MKRRSFWFAVDVLLGLVICLTGIVKLATFTPTKPTVETLGLYAVVITWPGDDDVDLYVQDPDGNVVWYARQDAGLMHLEHDDLGDAQTRYGKRNGERLVVRGATTGEFVVDCHMYSKTDPGPTKVSVELWRLAGNDALLTHRIVTLTRNGDEVTAFRFSLNRQGLFTGTSLLPKSLVGGAVVR